MLTIAGGILIAAAVIFIGLPLAAALIGSIIFGIMDSFGSRSAAAAGDSGMPPWLPMAIISVVAVVLMAAAHH